MSHIWVVEMKFEGDDDWEPTDCVGLTRDYARSEQKAIGRDDYFVKYRIRKYVREEKK